MLEASGWHIQNYAGHDTGAALGVAVREYPLANAQRADYLLFVDGLAVGFIEAKKEGTTLSGAAQQASRYRANIPAGFATHQGCPLPIHLPALRRGFETREIPIQLRVLSLRFTRQMPFTTRFSLYLPFDRDSREIFHYCKETT